MIIEIKGNATTPTNLSKMLHVLAERVDSKEKSPDGRLVTPWAVGAFVGQLDGPDQIELFVVSDEQAHILLRGKP